LAFELKESITWSVIVLQTLEGPAIWGETVEESPHFFIKTKVVR